MRRQRWSAMPASQAETAITPFSALILSLAAGKIDMIAAAMLRTPERERVVAFSDPIYHYAGALIVRGDDKRDRRSNLGQPEQRA